MSRSVVFLFLWLIPLVSFAQSDEFIIRTLVGNDTTPPSVPSGVTATPVSPYQIDIAWNPSTDNFAMGGYRISRDGLHIATTSLTTFSDTGLLASTTYSYTIDAFDVFYNFSSTSSPVATTTFPVPVPPVATSTPSTDSTPSATAVPALRSFSITPQQQSAVIDFASYGPTRYIIRFGRTSAYELGSVSTNLFKITQQAIVSGLEPGTTYYIEVTLVNGFGVERVVRQDQFTTLAPVTSSVPLSVTKLRGVIDNNDVSLRWDNPSDFATVRVVRSHLFYPTDMYDGVTVYQGRGSDVVDKGVLRDMDTVYYAVFVITSDGRVAAPAVLRLTKNAVGGLPSNNNQSELASSSPALPDVTAPNYERFLQPSDIFFTVSGTTTTFDSLRVITTDERVLVSIPATAVPNHLKTILVSVYDPTNNNNVTSYLLKLRGDGEAYEASFRSSKVVGEGRIIIELYDYEQVVVRRISRVVSYITDGTSSIFSYDFFALFNKWVGVLTLSFFIVAIGWWLLLFLRRRRREDNRSSGIR